jgi:phospholipase C
MVLSRWKRVGRGCFLLAISMAAGCTELASSDFGSGARRVARPAPGKGRVDLAAKFATATPVKHVVVVFGENISFDHYFGTYPDAKNLEGEPPFEAAPGTPTPNNLRTPLDPLNGFAPLTELDLLKENPNLTPANGEGNAVNPFRLPPKHASTADMGHSYTQEQQASNGGKMDLFPWFTGAEGALEGVEQSSSKGLVMAYFDGNTVSALWRFAQEFSLNDNSWTSIFGPSTPGAINLISGQTNGIETVMMSGNLTPDGNGNFSMIGDPEPIGDTCSTSSDQVSMRGRNIGDLLNAKGISWGWFQGGFDLGSEGAINCQRVTPQTVPGAWGSHVDYIPHHQPFQYYPSTANPTHARPSTVQAIGWTFQEDGTTPDPANHQYDSRDFFAALKAGNFPAVSYLKAPAFQDGHAGYSNPIDEQNFIVEVVSAVRASPEWETTAIILAYDDSDGWYDHQAPPIVNPSTGGADALNGPNKCTEAAQQRGAAPSDPLHGHDGKPALGRCGYGTRLPLLVLSPFAKKNHIDHTLTDQSSILRFIEDNWLGGERIQPGGSFDTIAGTIENMFQF